MQYLSAEIERVPPVSVQLRVDKILYYYPAADERFCMLQFDADNYLKINETYASFKMRMDKLLKHGVGDEDHGAADN